VPALEEITKSPVASIIAKFGEMVLLTHRPRSADVVALTFCRPLVMRKADYDRPAPVFAPIKSMLGEQFDGLAKPAQLMATDRTSFHRVQQSGKPR